MNRTVRRILVFVIWFSVQAASAQTNFDNQNQSFAWQNVVETESNAAELSRQWNGDSIRRSVALYLTASAEWRHIGENQKAANCLREGSRLKLLLGENQEAIAMLNQNIKIDAQGNDTVGKVKTYSLFSIALLRLGRFKEAEDFSNRAVALSETTVDLTAQATALTTVAEINYERKKVDGSLTNYEKALDLWRTTGDLRGEAQTLLAVSYVYMTKGELAIALQKAEESLTKWREINDPRGQTLARIAVGVMNSKLGNKQVSLKMFQQVESVFPDDMDFLEKGDLYNRLAQIYKGYGDLQLSFNYHLKAFELFGKEQNPYAQLATLPCLGIVSYQLGDKDSSLRYFAAGFELAEDLEDEYYYSILLEESGNAYFESEQTKAIKFYTQALENFERFGFKNRVALIQSKLGVIYQSQSRFALARRYFDSALKINRENKNKFAEAETLYHLSKLDSLANNDENAFKLVKDSVEITEALYSDVINARLKQTFFSNVFDRYELYINLLVKRHEQFPSQGFDLQALQVSEKARARSMLETLSLAETDFKKDADPELVKQEKELRNSLNLKTDILTELLSKNSDRTQINKITNEIYDLRNQLEEVKGILKHNSPLYSAIKNPPPFNIEEFRHQVLDDETLLLEFSFGNDESYLWLVGKTELSLYVLPSRRLIEPRIEKLRELLAARELPPGESVKEYQSKLAESEQEYEREAQLLSNQLLGRIADKLSGKRLVIVPDGKLNYFPISALPLPNSDNNQPILLSNETIYEPSASTLVLIEKSKKMTAATSKDLIVFSDPIFSKEDERLLSKNKSAIDAYGVMASLGNFRVAEKLNSLSRLKASGQEADSIAGIVGTSDSTFVSGFAANREFVLNDGTSDYKIIHFATHGLLNEEHPELSGIVLSRYDEKGNNQEGLIRLQDIYNLNLSADLVVLSACNTGIGKEIKGEGLISLNNAFLQVGAKSVVSSLWKVDDYAAQELMKNFYQELSSGEISTSEALRRAQIKMLRNSQYKSPFYWAAFTIKGDFQTTPKFSRNSASWIYLFLLVPFSLPGIYFCYRKFRSSNRKVVDND